MVQKATKQDKKKLRKIEERRIKGISQKSKRI